jgi:hypothetical protein
MEQKLCRGQKQPQKYNIFAALFIGRNLKEKSICNFQTDAGISGTMGAADAGKGHNLRADRNLRKGLR